MIYVDFGKYKKAIDYFILALKKNSEYQSVIINLINALTHYSPNIDHPIIDADKNIKKLGNIIILDDLLDKNKLKVFEDINKIKVELKQILNFSNSQVFRKILLISIVNDTMMYLINLILSQDPALIVLKFKLNQPML